MDDVTKSKLVAYLGYCLGREARSPRTLALNRNFIISEATRYRNKIRSLEATPTNLRREIFFVFVLAEASRLSNNIEFRERASELGDLISDVGWGNPFRFYMGIVKFTSRQYNTGNFGDPGSYSTEGPIEDFLGGDGFDSANQILKEFDLRDEEITYFNSYDEKSISEIASILGLD